VPPIDVLFVCLHGAGKSVVAAEHFRRLARARGLRVTASSAGIEPDPEIHSHVVAGLASDGIRVENVPPRRVTDAMLADSRLVVSFGCTIDAAGEGADLYWDDVPHVSDGYAEARDAIVAKVTALVDRLVGPPGGSSSESSE
jgi:arsenate reductase